MGGQEAGENGSVADVKDATVDRAGKQAGPQAHCHVVDDGPCWACHRACRGGVDCGKGPEQLEWEVGCANVDEKGYADGDGGDVVERAKQV